MVPVAVSVPNSADLSILMRFDNWAFGAFEGKPREE